MVFEIIEDDRFERDGEDLYCEVLITYPQAVLGADVDAPGVTGSLSLRVPPGTQSGQVFTLRGRGLPRVNASGTGDLHVRVQVWTPQRLAKEEERLLEQLHQVQARPPEKRAKGFWSTMKDALNG